MKKIGIFYGSMTGTTQQVAEGIAKLLGVAEADVHDVGKTAPSAVSDYDILVLGTSTWDTFCSAVGELHDRLEPTGAKFIAPYDTIGYEFEESRAKPEDALEAYGLLLDEVNHPELTAPRLAGWTTLVKQAAEA